MLRYLLLALVLCGCATQPHRARQHASYYDTLPPAVQERLLRSEVQPGDTPRMVTIALGEPDRRLRYHRQPGETGEQWIYLGHWVDNDDGSRAFMTRSDFDLPRQLGSSGDYEQLRFFFVEDALVHVR